MKGIISKTWFQMIFFGILIGAALILLDNKFDFFHKKGSQDSDTYNGPVSVEKSKTYFTEMEISEKEINFGTVKEGDTLKHVLKITNRGKEPLVIYRSTGSCECVGAQVTHEMIQPGVTVEMTVYFNAKGRKGLQNRTLQITANTDPADILIPIKADVQ